MKREFDPDFLFLEPSELVLTDELRRMVEMGLRDIQYKIGPFITLIDCSDFSFQFEVRPRLLLGQVDKADQVVLTHVDQVGQSEIDRITADLNIGDREQLRLGSTDRSAISSLLSSIVQS